jgi:ATP-dependent DNA helicase RecQ
MATHAPSAPSEDPRAELRRLFGYPEFRAGQEEVVRAVLAGEDVLAVMPTGAGKSLCYQLPSVLLPGCTVVISPLVALMKDQVDSLPPELRARAAVFNSTIEREELDAAGAELAAGGLKLVYVAPERLRQRPFLHALQRADISRLVVDEAHCISLWGHDFRPDYLFIPAVIETLGHPPVLLMTATATPELQRDLRGRFGHDMRVVNNGVLRPNLFLSVERAATAEQKLRRLIELCEAERGAGIVYVSSRERAEQVAGVLRRHGISARHYHAGLERGERADVQDAFMSGRVRIIVATVAFGMGVDKPDVRFIVHFNPSRSLEAYAQESGRAGRDGHPSRCILFWAPSDKASLGRWAHADALTPELLRAVYRGVRQGARGRFAWWPLDTLTRVVQGLTEHEVNDTDVRVALGALEQVGVLRRHCDLPEAAQLTPRPPSLPGKGEIDGTGVGVRTARVSAESDVEPPGSEQDGSPFPATEASRVDYFLERTTAPMFDLAARLGCTPAEVEERLLTARDRGEIVYVGVGRGLLVELFPHPPDLAARLRGLLDGHRQAQEGRLEEMAAYAAGRLCRTATIALHFGVAHSGSCEHCDICRTREQGRANRAAERPAVDLPALDRAPEDTIIECITALPFPMGRRGVSRVLHGSVASAVQADRSRHFGALAAMTITAIEREIDRMVDAGCLARGDDEYRLLTVTAAGLAKEPGTPPPPSSHQAVRVRSGSGIGERGRVHRREGEGQAAGLPSFAADAPVIEERFARLREWRTAEARAAALPAYTVLHDATLRTLAGLRVGCVEDLARVKGLGPAKLERYGAALLELLREG